MSKKYGYKCPCGKWNDAEGWAVAHWSIPLIHKCECGRENDLRSGEVRNKPKSNRNSKRKA